MGPQLGLCWLCLCALSPSRPCGRSCRRALWPGRAGRRQQHPQLFKAWNAWSWGLGQAPGGPRWVPWLCSASGCCGGSSLLGLLARGMSWGRWALQGTHVLPRSLLAPKAVSVQDTVPQEGWATEISTGAALQLPRELRVLHPPAPCVPRARCAPGEGSGGSGGCGCATRQRAGVLLRSGGSGAGRAARAVCRCRLGGGRFPGEGRLRSWLGNVGVRGQGGPGPGPAAGACSCLPIPVGAAPAAAGLAAAFPKKQLRLSAWLASSPLTWLLHETGRSSFWIHLWATLLRLL